MPTIREIFPFVGVQPSIALDEAGRVGGGFTAFLITHRALSRTKEVATMPVLITSHPLAELSSLEVHQMYKLRVDVFVHEQRCTYAEIDDYDAQPSTHHVLAWDVEKHALLGTARIFPINVDKQQAWKFGRFCLTPTARGTGLAADIMAHALSLSESESVVLDAQVPLVEFYRGFGFKPVGEEFDDEGMMHQPMRRDTPETAALAD